MTNYKLSIQFKRFTVEKTWKSKTYKEKNVFLLKSLCLRFYCIFRKFQTDALYFHALIVQNSSFSFHSLFSTNPLNKNNDRVAV